MGDINMYVRNVWNRSTKERVVSRALVIEVDKKSKEQAIDAMIAIDLNSEYRGAKFIRFNKMQFDSEIMNNILKKNNGYHGQMRKRKIEGLGPTLDGRTPD